MSNEVESYIVLKPIAERFSRIANEISDDEIKYMIKDAMKERIAKAVNYHEAKDFVASVKWFTRLSY